MLNKQEELFVKRIVTLEFEKYKLSIIEGLEKDLKENKERYINDKSGYEVMTQYDTNCIHLCFYPESREFITDVIASELPKDLRNKIKKERIDLASYWNDMFEIDNFDFTLWWNQMIALTYMEFASKYFNSVEEVDKIASPDMSFWPDSDDLKVEMDKQTKGNDD